MLSLYDNVLIESLLVQVYSNRLLVGEQKLLPDIIKVENQYILTNNLQQQHIPSSGLIYMPIPGVFLNQMELLSFDPVNATAKSEFSRPIDIPRTPPSDLVPVI